MDKKGEVSKDSFMVFFSTFLVNISLENYLLGGISMYVSYMLCSDFLKEDFIWLYFNQNACAKSHLQGQSYQNS